MDYLLQNPLSFFIYCSIESLYCKFIGLAPIFRIVQFPEMHFKRLIIMLILFDYKIDL